MVPARIAQLVCVQGRPTLRQPAAGTGTRLLRGPLVEQAEADRRGVAPPHVVGHQRVAQVGAASRKWMSIVAAPERIVVEHGLQQVAIGLETVELEGPQRQRQLATAADRSSPCAISLATSES